MQSSGNVDFDGEQGQSTTGTGLARSGAEPGFSLRDLLSVLFFYWRTAALLVLGVTVLAILLAIFLPPSYTSRARLLTLNAGVYTMQARQGAAPADDPAAAVNVEMQLLASSELHRAMARTAMGAEANVEAINRWVRRFEAHLHLARLESSNVIEAEYTDRDPEKAAAALRLLLSGYFSERANVLTSGRVGFLTAQRDKVRAQLDQVDAQISAYELQNGVVDMAGQVTGAVDLDNRLREQQQAAEAAVADGQKNVMVLLANEKTVPKQVELYSDDSEAAHTLGTMQTALLQLEAKRADLASRYMAQSPYVEQADAQIRELRASIKAQQGTLGAAHRVGYNTNLDTVRDQLISAEANLAGASARSNTLKGQVASSASRLKGLVAVSDTLTKLHTQHDLLAETYKGYAEQVELARVDQNQAASAGTTNVRVIESPAEPDRRNNPPLLIIAAGVVSGLLIAGVAVFLLSSLRETFLSPHEAERGLGLPVLCALPEGAGGDSGLRRYFGPVVAAIAAQPGRAGSGKVVLLLTPNDASGQTLACRGLLAALEARSPGRNVVLHLLPGPVQPGTEFDGVVRPGGSASLPVESPREDIEDALAFLRSAFDGVLVAAPPASGCFEAIEAAGMADVVLLVLQAEATRKAVANGVVGQVRQVGGHVNGVVMTGRRFHIPNWAYRLWLHEAPRAA